MIKYRKKIKRGLLFLVMVFLSFVVNIPNSITCFRVDPQTGMLIKTSVVKMPGSFPRDFNLTPDGRFLIVGIQHDDKILAYEIDYQNGTLHYTGKQWGHESSIA